MNNTAYYGPTPNTELENSIGKEVTVQDFSGKEHQFIIVGYSNDLIKFKVLHGESAGAIISIDLGTCSKCEVTVRSISLNGKILFDTESILQHNLEKAQKDLAVLDVSNIIKELREEVIKQIHGLTGSMSQRGKLPNSITSDISTRSIVDELIGKAVGDGIFPEDYIYDE